MFRFVGQLVGRGGSVTTRRRVVVNNQRRRRYAMSADSHGLIPKLSKASRMSNIKVPYPRIAVVGNQSSGKSSVLDALMGVDLLPKGDSMVTRRPIEVNLIHDTSRWGRVDGSQHLSIEEMRKRINEENQDIDFTDVPLKIEYHSPEVPDLMLVDLPGYITAVNEDQDRELPKKIKGLCSRYLADDQNLILCVVSGGADIAVSKAVEQARKYDSESNRTMGVLTKMDLCKPTTVRRILKNEKYRLPLGYLGVRCRTFDEIQRGVSFEQLVKIEEKFIRDKHLNDLPVGLPFMRQKLADMLLHRIMNFFPEILESISKAIEVKNRNNDLLTQLYKHRDLESIAHKLEQLVNHFHVNSHSRLRLEMECRQKIHQLFGLKFKEISQRMTGGKTPSQLFNQELVLIKNDQKDGKNGYPYPKYTWGNYRDVFYHEQAPKADPNNQEITNDLMIYGNNTPKHVDHQKLRMLSDNLLRTGVVSRHFYPIISEDYAVEKSEWHEKMEGELSRMIDQGIGEETRLEVITTLINFVRNLSVNRDTDNHDKDQELARFFFEYLIGQINERTDYQQVADQISFMLNREKRPQMDFYSLLRKISDGLEENGVPLYTKGWFLYEMHDYKFPIYQQVWTMGYLKVLCDRMSDDTYRIFAVNVIDKLIFETLHNSLKLFKSGKIFREAKKQMDEQKTLEEIRGMIQHFHEQQAGSFNPIIEPVGFQPVEEKTTSAGKKCRQVKSL